MGRGGQKREVVVDDSQRDGRQMFPWSEIARHTDRNDRWIVIEGEIYDVTRWSRRHPGGSRLLGHYAGQDATVRTFMYTCTCIKTESIDA